MACTRHLPLALTLLLVAAGLASCGGKKKKSQLPAYPEDNLTYAVSSFALPINPQNALESMKTLMKIVGELQSGTPFSEVASKGSSDDQASVSAGWMGFMRPQQDNSITGAYQALQPGQWGGPVQHEQAAHFFYRHTFDEGRRIEEEAVIPAYGFFVPRSPEDPESVQKEYEVRAKEAWEKVSRGELTFAQAGEAYGISVTRPDGFIVNAGNNERDAELRRILEQVEPGELAPLSEMPGVFVVARRGVYFRSHIRHIMIQHVESENRPLTVSRSKDEAKALAEKILSEVEDGSLTWEDAVIRHSDDLGTAGLLGWIGAVTNGDMVPEFEKVILATKPGDIADEVVELDDGFHILHRVN